MFLLRVPLVPLAPLVSLEVCLCDSIVNCCDIFRIICHIDLKCGSINFPKRRKQPTNNQYLGIYRAYQKRQTITLREKCPYSELFWSSFSCIRAEYGEVRPYSARMRENSDQNNSKYGHFLSSVNVMIIEDYESL